MKFNYNVHGRMLMNLYPILTRFKKQNNITDRTLGLLLFLYGENIHTSKSLKELRKDYSIPAKLHDKLRKEGKIVILSNVYREDRTTNIKTRVYTLSSDMKRKIRQLYTALLNNCIDDLGKDVVVDDE